MAAPGQPVPAGIGCRRVSGEDIAPTATPIINTATMTRRSDNVIRSLRRPSCSPAERPASSVCNTAPEVLQVIPCVLIWIKTPAAAADSLPPGGISGALNASLANATN
jgi:hypothetical protein